MIVCSCNVITHTAIEEAVGRIHEREPSMLVTPGMVYKELGLAPDCGVCLCHICELIHECPAPSPPRLAKHARRPSAIRRQNVHCLERF